MYYHLKLGVVQMWLQKRFWPWVEYAYEISWSFEPERLTFWGKIVQALTYDKYWIDYTREADRRRVWWNWAALSGATPLAAVTMVLVAAFGAQLAQLGWNLWVAQSPGVSVPGPHRTGTGVAPARAELGSPTADPVRGHHRRPGGTEYGPTSGTSSSTLPLVPGTSRPIAPTLSASPAPTPSNSAPATPPPTTPTPGATTAPDETTAPTTPPPTTNDDGGDGDTKGGGGGGGLPLEASIGASIGPIDAGVTVVASGN